MGGLINGSTVKGDLWMIEAGGGNLACYPIGTTSEGPGPRVGHASLLVGNAFIVFGGDTKMDDRDMLDDTLYLLNTCMLKFCQMLLFKLMSLSNTPMDASAPPRPETCRTIWAYSQHIGLEDIYLWGPGGRLFLQRPSCL